MRLRVSVVWAVFLVMALVVFTQERALAQNYEQQLKTVCSSLGSRLMAQKKTTAAVVDFTDLNGNVTALGRFLAEELSGCLVRETADLQVVERLRLSAVLREQKLGESPVIDQATAKKLGEIVGAEAIITGTLTPFGETVRMSARALDVGTARVIGAATADIPKTRAIEELLAQDSGGKGPTQANIPLTAAATPVGQPSGSGSPVSPTAPPTQRQTVAGITWELMDCLKDALITCRIMVTNNENSFREVQMIRPAARDDRNNDATARTPSTLRLQPGAEEVVRLTFGGLGFPFGGTRSTGARFGADSNELASIQLEYRVAGRQGIIRFQHIPLK